ncbi:hypothetical protein [Geminicoccus flavidas]|uniref:hypothetical protein n=1 Tax=Geminicoccus flavidas TaxID=2506407 RepID=UPI001356EA49|nr:hypothetical protein [Geminicoccus flavidas]
MSYVPHPSTIAHRAIEHLKGLPPGGTIATGPLAEILGTDTGTILTGLQTAIKHDVVVRERINGLFHWRMADQSARVAASPEPLVDKPSAPKVELPKPKPEPDERRFEGVSIDGPRARRPEPEPEPPAAEPVAPAAEPLPEAEPVVDPLPVEMPPVVLVSEVQPFRFSWCNDGTITVSKGGGSVVLDKADYEELARFIYVLRNHL